MENMGKRKADDGGDDDSNKRSKTKKQWRLLNKSHDSGKGRTIQPGESGIWATCDKGREGKCTAELRDLFNEYAEELYGDILAAEDTDENANGGDDAETSIENEIKQELEGIRRPKSEPLFIPIKLDVQCVLFFRTRAPVDPIAFVRHICRDALTNPQKKRTRFVKRFSPMTLMGKANEEGLEKVAKEVLSPLFHQDSKVSHKFAIRPTIRNHNVMKRDDIIRQIASIVGPSHKVDLKNPDFLIIVELYTNICGMSVVPNDFEELKRYNLAEIFDPTPKETPKAPVHEAMRTDMPTRSEDAMEM